MKTKGILVIPKDFPLPGPLADYEAAFRAWLRQHDEWFSREIEKTLDWEVMIHQSQQSLDTLQRPFGGGESTADAHAQGLELGSFWLHVIHIELGLPVWHEPGPWKWGAAVLGAGGWAGGASDNGGPNTGWWIVGDWGLNFDVTGLPDPGCVAHYGEGACSPKSTFGAWGHESLHGCYVDSHSPVVNGGDELSDQQKADLLANNEIWLIESGSAEEPCEEFASVIDQLEAQLAACRREKASLSRKAQAYDRLIAFVEELNRFVES